MFTAGLLQLLVQIQAPLRVSVNFYDIQYYSSLAIFS